MSTAPKIFLSYRRDDSAFQTTAIHERLTDTFGAQNVFMDVDNIPAGRDFRRHLQLAVEQCDVCLIIIGDRWLNSGESANARRIDDPRDFVRIEIEAALKRDIPVIPLMVGKSPMPTANELPDCIAELSYRQGLSVRPGRDFRSDMQLLVNQIRQNTAPPPKETNDPVPVKVPEIAVITPAAAPIEEVDAVAVATTLSDSPIPAFRVPDQVEDEAAPPADQNLSPASRSIIHTLLWPVIQISRAYERLLDFVSARPIQLMAAHAILLSLSMWPFYSRAKALSSNHPDLQSLIFWLNPLLLICCILAGSWCRRRIDHFTASKLPFVAPAIRADASIMLILIQLRVLFAIILAVSPPNSFSLWVLNQGLLPFGVALAVLLPLTHTASLVYRSRLLRTMLAAGIWTIFFNWLMPSSVRDNQLWYAANYWFTAFWALTAVGVNGMTKFWSLEKPAPLST